MISHNLRVRLGAAIEEYVTPRLELYENRFSGVNDVKNFYFFVADILHGEGCSDEEIVELYNAHKGNYLLLMRNSVTASDFARRILEGKVEQTYRTMYIIDQKLPASGYRNKEQNVELVLLSLKEFPSLCMSVDTWRFNMAVNPGAGTYNAVLHQEEPVLDDSVVVSRVSDMTLRIPDEAIDALVKFASDPSISTIGQDDLFPGVSILDGVSISLHIRSKAGRFKMEDNLFIMTEDDGIIKTANKEYQTGIHLIRQAIADALGEETEAEEED